MYNSMDAAYWENLGDPLTQVTVSGEGKIEDLDDHLMVDFANKYIGGGVMNMGMV